MKTGAGMTILNEAAIYTQTLNSGRSVLEDLFRSREIGGWWKNDFFGCLNMVFYSGSF